MSDFLTETFPMAKKEHKCYICNELINKGENYVKQVGKFQDNFYDIKLHNNCYSILINYLDELDYYDLQEGWTLDYLRDYWIGNKCYNCLFNELNGGNCDEDLDKNCWCSKFKFLMEE